MLLLAAVLVIVSTVQANGKTLVLEPVVDCLFGTYIWDNAWKSKYFYTALSYKTISPDCYTGKAATKKMKIVTSMKRIRTWEDCREKCNTNDWCDFFSFKVSLFCFGRNGEDAIYIKLFSITDWSTRDLVRS